MIPPSGFKAEVYPLRHRLIYSMGLSLVTTTKNSCYLTILRHSSDVQDPDLIVVNPHNAAYVTETGSVCQKMSIIDKLSMSLKFNMTSMCNDKAHTSGVSGAEVFTGDGIQSLKFLWRPVFFSFPEKLDAADDDTSTTVAAILGLTKDATFEDVVPLTTTKLSVTGTSDLGQPLGVVNTLSEDYTDYNMTTNATAENHPWDEDLFQEATRRYTNKGALKACVGRTRHVILSRDRPFKNFFIDKFVPRAVRRIMPYSHFGIQIYMASIATIDQQYAAEDVTPNVVHLGVKAVFNYHEWNADHFQDMSGTPPT